MHNSAPPSPIWRDLLERPISEPNSRRRRSTHDAGRAGRQSVSNAVRTMPRDQRKAIHAAWSRGVPASTIAAEHGIEPHEVRWIWRRIEYSAEVRR